MDPQIYRALRHIPYGIYLLIAGPKDQEKSMIVSWVSQISYSPPLLVIILRHNRPVLHFLQRGNFLSLNLLEREQRFIVPLVKKGISPLKLPEFTLQRGREEVPFLKEALANWTCQVHSLLTFGDHVMVISEVKWADSTAGVPLTTLDYGKTYLGED